MESDGKQVYAGVGVCRRLKPNQHQACIKCPRCDSLNTKFCYYNNYNLSQPRHFCKGCRRYWTKGGVLRNVPVGGGCRKTKRSKPKLSVIPTDTSKKLKIKSNSNSNSNSKSGSESAGAVTSDVLSAISTNSSLPEFPESTINDHTSEADELIFKDDIGMMFDEIAGATSVIDMKFDEMPTVDFFDDQTAQGYWRNGGDGGGGSGLFDLTGSNDHQSYWSQTHGWGENDYSLNYFP